MADTKDRPHNLETEYEDLKPVGEGSPPRSASEPRGSEGSARNPHTDTDPASGEPQDRDEKGRRREPAASRSQD